MALKYIQFWFAVNLLFFTTGWSFRTQQPPSERTDGNGIKTLPAYAPLGNRTTTTRIQTERDSPAATTNTTHWVIDHDDPLKRPLIECNALGAPLRYYI